MYRRLVLVVGSYLEYQTSHLPCHYASDSWDRGRLLRRVRDEQACCDRKLNP
jgi:hypothetical protein